MNRQAFIEYWELLGDFEDHLAGGWRRAGRPEAPEPAPIAERPVDAPEAQPAGRSAALEALAGRIRACRLCGLHQGRIQAVPGLGVLDASVMVIGEGPGAEEDRSGEPFVGAAGRFLDKWLAAIGLDRSRNVFIANTVKCRPPANRDPLPEETRACLPYLEAQLALVKPKAILVVGSVAARVLLKSARGVSALRGQWFELNGIPLICTYHPSAVLRDDSLKRPVWDDLKKLNERLPHA